MTDEFFDVLIFTTCKAVLRFFCLFVSFRFIFFFVYNNYILYCGCHLVDRMWWVPSSQIYTLFYLQWRSLCLCFSLFYCIYIFLFCSVCLFIFFPLNSQTTI